MLGHKLCSVMVKQEQSPELPVDPLAASSAMAAAAAMAAPPAAGPQPPVQAAHPPPGEPEDCSQGLREGCQGWGWEWASVGRGLGSLA